MLDTDENTDLARLTEWLSNLTLRAELLRSEVRSKQAELARIEERLSLIGRLIEVESETGPTGDSKPDPKIESSSARTVPSPIGLELEDAVEAVLRENGAPQHISVIHSQLLARGVQIPGRGDDANIIVRLRRFSSRFTRTARGTYGLAEWGIPEMTRKRRRHRGAAR